MAKRFTDTEKYKKKFIRGLQGAYKLLWDYLYHDCDHAGIWYVDFEIAQIYLGTDIQVNETEALRVFNNGEKRIFILENGKKWFIPSFIEFQYGILNPENRAHKSVIDRLIKNGLDKELTSSLQGRKDKETNTRINRKDKEGESEGKLKRFIVPTLEEIEAYCKERKNNVNPKKWLSHYQAKNWFIGKNKMADWKAAVRTWEEDGFTSGQEADREKLKRDLKQAYQELEVKRGYLDSMGDEDPRRSDYTTAIERLNKKIEVIEMRLQNK